MEIRELRGKTNAYSIGSNSVVLTVPKEIATEFDINTVEKKTFFDIYTDYSEGKKKIIFELSGHAFKHKEE